jgi:glycosyltransferase involved in cell wall biosynthesis
LKKELGVPVIGFLQGEDSFIDGLGAPWSKQVWALLAERMRDADVWIAPSRYFADSMAQRLGWSGGEEALRIRIVPNGISTDGFSAEPSAPPAAPTIGYLARFVPGKGLGVLVEAFIELKRRGLVPNAKLRCAGSMTAGDARYVETLKARLAQAGVSDDVEWLPNVSREEKIAFLESLTVFSVPASTSEAFGMYVIEALAAGAPVVLPRAWAFPEIIDATGGGILYEPTRGETANGQLLATALEPLLRNREEATALGQRGWYAVRREYSLQRFAERLTAATREMIDAPQPVS